MEISQRSFRSIKKAGRCQHPPAFSNAEPLYDRNVTLRLFCFPDKRRFFQTLTGAPVAAQVQHDEMLYREDFQGWVEAQEAFRGIAEFCRARDIPVVFSIYANNIRLSGTLETDAMLPIIQKVTTTLLAQDTRHVGCWMMRLDGMQGRSANCGSSPTTAILARWRIAWSRKSCWSIFS